MALSDYKVTDEELSTGVVSLEDKPQLSAQELKRAFDRLMRDVTSPKLNALIDALVSTNAANEIGAKIDGLEGDTVASVLAEIKQSTAGYIGEERISDTLIGAEETNIPTVKAVNDALIVAGAGDMLKSVYDPQDMKQDVFAYAKEKADEAWDSARIYADTKAPMYQKGIDDLVAGESELADDILYFVYE